MDVKPWDDETDMVGLEAAVRSIEQDGLVWGASKLVPIGYGIKKLQITLVVGMSLYSSDKIYIELQRQRTKRSLQTNCRKRSPNSKISCKALISLQCKVEILFLDYCSLVLTVFCRAINFLISLAKHCTGSRTITVVNEFISST